MFHRIIKITLLAMIVVCAARLTFSVASAGNVIMHRKIPYVKDGGERQQLDIYLPNDYKTAEKPLPVIVFLHGGYWEFGDKSHVADFATFAAENGVAAVAVNYRFVPDNPMPAQIEDVKAAIRWLRAHAKRYNLDTDRFGAWGYSAGAHLTALLCTMTTREFDVGGHLDQPSTVRCGVVVAGPTDFEAFVEEAPEIEEECEKVFGGDRDEKLELIRKMGAVNHVTKDSSPMLIFHAEDDDVVLVSQARLLHKTMKQAGAASTLIILPAGGGGHVSDRLFDEAAAKWMTQFFAKYVKNAESPSVKTIFEAAKTGTVNDLRVFVLQGHDINTHGEDIDGLTPLHWAARSNPDVDVLKYLIEQGADVHAKDYMSQTPLHRAARSNKNVHILKTLLENGADVHSLDNGGWTPLHHAANYNSESGIAKLLVEHEADVNAKHKYGETPLHCAAANSNTAVVIYLIEQGADVHAKDKDGETPLHCAACSGPGVDVLKILVAHGAKINAKDKDEQTPLHLAARSNTRVDVLETLVKLGADVNGKDRYGRTPLHHAARSNRNADTLKTLLALKADVNAGFPQGLTPLNYAKTEEKQAILQAAGGRKTFQNIFAAAANGSITDLQFFIDQGIDVNTPNKVNPNWRHSISGRPPFNGTPLHYASRFNPDVDVLKYLIEQGADVNVKNIEGNTPLDIADTKQKEEILLKGTVRK